MNRFAQFLIKINYVHDILHAFDFDFGFDLGISSTLISSFLAKVIKVNTYNNIIEAIKLRALGAVAIRFGLV